MFALNAYLKCNKTVINETCIFSIPVCGCTKAITPFNELLCVRWYIVAATMPIFRISSQLPRRDPLSLTTGLARNAAIDAIKKRYALLPYIHTILNTDPPLTRPMWYDYAEEKETLRLVEQYMVGNSLLVAHPFLPDLPAIRVYLPRSKGVWYEFFGGRKYDRAGWVTVDVVATDWIVFMAQGSIVPLRNVSTKLNLYNLLQWHQRAGSVHDCGYQEINGNVCHGSDAIRINLINLIKCGNLPVTVSCNNGGTSSASSFTNGHSDPNLI